jgi:hypothetical protein
MQAALLAALTFAGAGVVLAQEAPLIDPSPSDPAVAVTPTIIPLSIGQKYLYSLGEIFGPDRLVAVGAHAALDQMGVRPVQWGGHPESFAIRFASYFGDSLLKHTIEFGVRAVDHEDPRYFRMGHGRPLTRFGHAVFHTFVVHSDRGGWMPAYSLPVEAFATPYLVRQWRPERFHTSTTLEAGTLNVGIEMGANILREFWPDMRRALPDWFTHNNPFLPAPRN